MFLKFLSKVFGTRNSRLLKQYGKILCKVNSFSVTFKMLSSDELKLAIDNIKYKFKKNINLELILPEVYALVREVSTRVLGMRHYDVQILGGIVLYYGKIAEIATGEGKTLIATLPVCLNALNGKTVHIVTVNDYLAKRDAVWMMPVYEFFGLTTGIITSDIDFVGRKKSYCANIVYGTNNEFGFDYLRDNIVLSKEDKVQHDLYYAIIDEVDSILVDEARTPLVISSSVKNDYNLYGLINKIVLQLNKYDNLTKLGDFIVDEKNKQIQLTDLGFLKLENLFVKNKIIGGSVKLYEACNIGLLHSVYAALKANVLFKKDIDYIVQEDKIVIIDEHTGRIMDGRRWSDGVHQALEVKESVSVQSENQTLASITFQNYFRLYEKLSGMTGTAYTEAFEFQEIYNLEVVIVSTNRPNIRVDFSDAVFLTKNMKFRSIMEDIKACVFKQQPVLVGTVSIEVSEYISKLLKKSKIKHTVLNAKHHDKEASIISEAGKLGGVTIATNMAGRGTDIVLGGSIVATSTTFEKVEQGINYEKVLQCGGLKVIGTERHESRRIDNQLRGRAARQGDPGCSQFYLSLEDDLVRIFISDKIAELLNKINIEKNEIISHPLINKSIENAQRKVEGYNFNLRKQLLEFDNVIDEQRKIIYEQRDLLLINDNIVDIVLKVLNDVIVKFVSSCLPKNDVDDNVDLKRLAFLINVEFGFDLSFNKFSYNFIITSVLNECLSRYKYKKEKLGALKMVVFEKILFLNVLDLKWKEHLMTLEHLRKSIHLRGYAQKDPKHEYKREAFDLFSNMIDNAKHEFVLLLLKFPVNIDYVDVVPQHKDLSFKHEKKSVLLDNSSGLVVKKPFVRKFSKIGRNSLCFCGAKKKYKQCHGKDVN